jgi:putative DNA primase/helicase
MDFDRINDAARGCLESLLHAWFPAGRREGPEWKVGSLQGEPGRSLSISLRTGVWKDFSSDEGGSDPISLLAAIKGCDMGAAARELDELLQLGEFPKREAAQAVPKREEWEPLPHAPAAAPPASFDHFKHGAPSAVWTYRDAEGRIIGHVCRFDLGDGKKDVCPMAWCRNAEGRERWKWKSFPKPRPLYGLDELAAKPAAPVLVVEGEKCADAARALLQNAVVISWPGGGKAVGYTDWTPLAERRVTVWPDADEPGRAAAERIAAILDASAASVRVLAVHGRTEGWDVADAISEGWTEADIRGALKAGQIGEPEPVYQSEEQEAPRVQQVHPADMEEPLGYSGAHAEERTDSNEDDWPFRVLGYNKGAYFYLPDGSQQIIALTPSEHRELPLLQLAPANFWESQFPAKEGANYKAAANCLIQLAHRQGMFSHKQIRGRGAWIDGEATIYHLGDHLVVDGIRVPIRQHRSRYVYELAEHIDAPEAAPAPNAEAVKLLRVCELMPWKHPLHAKFLAGWLVLAPISGVLQWRPHVWINGPSGTGKSWILSNVVQRLIGSACINVQSATTEAGIRQSLGCDSLPVIFDEAESEDKRGQQRIQAILELARGASAETGAGIAKGTASGEAMVFRMRSSFCFASIGVAATQKADVSRITSLELQKAFGKTGEEAFALLKRLVNETAADPAWCDSVRSRSLSMSKVIRSNAAVFAASVAAHLGDQRVGDQLGTLLAGAFSLTSAKAVDRAFADDWVRSQDWGHWVPEDADKDEIRAFSMLCEATLRIDGDGAPKTVSVGELVKAGMRGEEVAVLALLRNGVKIRRDGSVAVSNTHHALVRIFDETPWAKKWHHQLLRLDGAAPSVERFNGLSQRAVVVPMPYFE